MPRTDSRRRELLTRLAAQYGTPLYVYDAQVIRAQFAKLRRFDVVRFAQKACPNTHVLRLLKGEGAMVDCVSAGELERAVHAGFSGGSEPAEIVFTADVLPREVSERVVELGVPVNAGSEDMLEQLGRVSPGHKVWLRINPGFGHGHSKKTSTGGENSKHGIWYANLQKALVHIDRYGLDLVGLHTHIGSGADIEHLGRVCDAMVEQVRNLGRDIRAISGGGGLSIPYRPNDPQVDTDAYFKRWDAARKTIEGFLGHPVHLELEPGRFLTAAAGVLVAQVMASKTAGSNHYTLVDAGFNDLVRPAMYGAWHEIEVLPASDRKDGELLPTIVGGPLCESGDMFTQSKDGDVLPRNLPRSEVGDLLVFHDAGAYGASMSSNYNSRPLAAEVLIDGDDHRLIRRRQSIQDLLALEAT
ncbi:MAG TPA: diaminopimelate decarboxylase [Polyangiaceae bacterium]|nr:diaminopimelate decarboxylase [Polyangiaceae bacterium]